MEEGLELSAIAYSASQLARFMTNPGPSHFKAVIRVLIYVRDTTDRALVMQPKPDRNLESYVDSNWATQFSCSGGMFFFYGCLFHWFSKMQRSVTLSSAEADPMTRNEERPNAKHEDAVSNTERGHPAKSSLLG